MPAKLSPPSVDAVPPVTDLTPTELHLEREKLALEREMVALDRERLTAERDKWATESALRGQAPGGMHVRAGVLGLAVAFALILGGLVGFNAGLETGRSQVPLPRTVRIGRHFHQMLTRTRFLPEPPAPAALPGFDFFALYRRPSDAQAAGNLVIVR